MPTNTAAAGGGDGTSHASIMKMFETLVPPENRNTQRMQELQRQVAAARSEHDVADGELEGSGEEEGEWEDDVDQSGEADEEGDEEDEGYDNEGEAEEAEEGEEDEEGGEDLEFDEEGVSTPDFEQHAPPPPLAKQSQAQPQRQSFFPPPPATAARTASSAFARPVVARPGGMETVQTVRASAAAGAFRSTAFTDALETVHMHVRARMRGSTKDADGNVVRIKPAVLTYDPEEDERNEVLLMLQQLVNAGVLVHVNPAAPLGTLHSLLERHTVQLSQNQDMKRILGALVYAAEALQSANDELGPFLPLENYNVQIRTACSDTQFRFAIQRLLQRYRGPATFSPVNEVLMVVLAPIVWAAMKKLICFFARGNAAVQRVAMRMTSLAQMFTGLVTRQGQPMIPSDTPGVFEEDGGNIPRPRRTNFAQPAAMADVASSSDSDDDDVEPRSQPPTPPPRPAPQQSQHPPSPATAPDQESGPVTLEDGDDVSLVPPV